MAALGTPPVTVPRLSCGEDTSEEGGSLASRIAKRRQDSARRRQMESPRALAPAPDSDGESGRAFRAPLSPSIPAVSQEHYGTIDAALPSSHGIGPADAAGRMSAARCECAAASYNPTLESAAAHAAAPLGWMAAREHPANACGPPAVATAASSSKGSPSPLKMRLQGARVDEGFQNAAKPTTASGACSPRQAAMCAWW